MRLFRENLQKKIEIDAGVRLIQAALNPGSESGISRVRDKLRSLLNCAGYHREQRRDLELYVPEDPQATEVIVLDNELPLYQTTLDDVVLRKSPTVKEMLSIRNAIKILNDADVVSKKRGETLSHIHEKCLSTLALTWTHEDLVQLETEGKAALDAGDHEWVSQILVFFAELNGWLEASLSLKRSGYFIFGNTARDALQKGVGPVVVYRFSDNSLMLSEAWFSGVSSDKFEDLLTGKTAPDRTGYDVFAFLKERLAR